MIFLAVFYFLPQLRAIAQSLVDRCSDNQYRTWWDVLHYNLFIDVNPDLKTIKGHNIIKAKAVIAQQSVMQIDLQRPLDITEVSIWSQSKKNWEVIPYNKLEHHILALIPFAPFAQGDTFSLKVKYEGKPAIAKNAPWDGGFVFSKDKNNQHFVGVAAQGIGASVFFPHKDLLKDEPDQGIEFTIGVKPPNVAIANGKKISVSKNKQTGNNEYKYQVINPINTYAISFYIGDYVEHKEKIKIEKEPIDFSFIYLKHNAQKAKNLIPQIRQMIDIMEFWCGPYPFPSDGIKFVESPYLGMEHQSAIAYGNGYKNGYLGKDRSGTGVGLLFDFIAIHELAHEWWGNAVSTANPCDMWINEGFATYMESLYIESEFGKEEAKAYRIGKQKLIQNDRPLMGNCTHCESGSTDIYDKGGALIHNLRLTMNNDTLFRKMLRAIQVDFKNKTINTSEIIDYLNPFFTYDIAAVVHQYLYEIQIPKFEYHLENGIFHYRWSQCRSDFSMPIEVKFGDESKWLSPQSQWQSLSLEKAQNTIKIGDEWYIEK